MESQTPTGARRDVQRSALVCDERLNGAGNNTLRQGKMDPKQRAALGL